jgi:hypothetical protein
MRFARVDATRRIGFATYYNVYATYHHLSCLIHSYICFKSQTHIISHSWSIMCTMEQTWVRELKNNENCNNQSKLIVMGRWWTMWPQVKSYRRFVSVHTSLLNTFIWVVCGKIVINGSDTKNTCVTIKLDYALTIH